MLIFYSDTLDHRKEACFIVFDHIPIYYKRDYKGDSRAIKIIKATKIIVEEFMILSLGNDSTPSRIGIIRYIAMALSLLGARLSLFP